MQNEENLKALEVYFNGGFYPADKPLFTGDNRAFSYGDGVFETIRYQNGELFFLEDHYFRLMSGMRIHRMDIPMDFTPEFMADAILKTITRNNLEASSCRVRLTVYRDAKGAYIPDSNNIGVYISVQPVNFATDDAVDEVRVQLYTDFYKQTGALSNSKALSAHLYVLAGIFARENGYQESLLLNERKYLVEGHTSNVFLWAQGKLRTPSLEEGCVKGVLRKQVIDQARKEGLEVEEGPISPFDLLKADEVWLTNVIKGIRPVTHYRKKTFKVDLGLEWNRHFFGN